MKIRIGNDFVFNWAIERGGLPEDLSSVLEKHLHLSVFGKKVELVEGVDYDITGNVIRIEVTPAIANIIGTYKAELHYILPDNGLIDEDRKCAVDVDAFQIVSKTAQADDSTEFSMTSDMAIAFKGDKGDSAYQVWLDAGNTGTEEDYFAYLQQPATDAIASIQAVEQTVSENESLRITSETNRKDAEDLRLSAEILRKENETERVSKESIRIENETERVSKESIRNENEAARVENEELRQSAETLRLDAELLRNSGEIERVEAEDLRQTNTSTAIQGANEAASLANQKANLASDAAINADNARLAIEGDLALKANHGYESNPKTLKQVDDSLVQLAGEVKYSVDVINEMTPMLLSLRNDVGETEVSRTIFPSNMYLSNIGNYVEIKCSCPEYVSGNSSNICMFIGANTRGGLYQNSFYFRSDSTAIKDYRIWTFPVGFDPKILHIYKLQIVDDGVGGKLWELFVDGVSWGTKGYSINANINRLNDNTAASSAVRYDYEYVNVKTIGEEKHFTAIELFPLSENAKILPVLTFESISQEQKEQNERLDEVEDIAENTKNKVINISNIYATDSYYSSYNRKFESDGIKSSTYLDKSYLIETEGDYFEIKARYYGSLSTYVDKLSLVTGEAQSSRFGWLSFTGFSFRPYGADNIIWNLSASGINLFEWNVYRLEVVSGGVELFINGVSMRTKPVVLTGYKINAIASLDSATGYVQKYDVKYFKAVSQIDGEIYIDPLAIYEGSENVELIKSKEEDGVFAPNPLCFVSYDNSAKEFNVYTRDEENQNTYYGFLIGLQTSRGTPNDPIAYSHAWKLHSGAIYTYDKQMNVMNPTGTTTVTVGESECVFMYTDPNGPKVDHTGGVHGDETIDVTVGDFAKFYVDGVALSESDLSASFSLRPCSEFKYIQKSSIHETAYYEDNVDTELAATGAGDLTLKSDTGTFAIDGIDTGIPAYAQSTVFASTQAIINDGITLSVSGANTWVLSRIRMVYNDHPIVASHLKKSVMKGRKFHTENTLIFNNTRDLEYWYVGIYCLGKGVATIGHNEDYEDVEFTGNKGIALRKRDDNYRLFEAYNPSTGCSAIVKNWIIENGNGVIDDGSCTLFIMDRPSDSKYYRNTGSFAPIIGKRMTTVTEVEYNKRSD